MRKVVKGFQAMKAEYLAAKAAVAADRAELARSAGADPLVIERLEAESILASLDARQAAGRLASSSERRAGASGAC